MRWSFWAQLEEGEWVFHVEGMQITGGQKAEHGVFAIGHTKPLMLLSSMSGDNAPSPWIWEVPMASEKEVIWGALLLLPDPLRTLSLRMLSLGNVLWGACAIWSWCVAAPVTIFSWDQPPWHLSQILDMWVKKSSWKWSFSHDRSSSHSLESSQLLDPS